MFSGISSLNLTHLHLRSADQIQIQIQIFSTAFGGGPWLDINPECVFDDYGGAARRNPCRHEENTQEVPAHPGTEPCCEASALIATLRLGNVVFN